MRMQGKNVIVTGGASGIGLASIERCLEEGASAVIADLEGSEGAARAAELDGRHGGRCLFKVCDVTDTAQVDRLFEETVAELGSVDAVFNNAGIGGITPTDEVTDEEFLRIIDINLNGVFRVARAALRVMYRQGSGSIVNCASILGMLGQSQTAAYTAAKGAWST
jgi:NAD(P)-dependent dehydrogenase (short-subunit alcohol dehydrogenase family)